MESFWGVYLPNWITAVAALAAIGGVIAAVLSLRADTNRDRRRKAEGLSAWWARIDDGPWGVVVHNGTDTTFHGIRVAARGGWHKDSDNTVLVRVLPPGDCFIRAGHETDKHAWEIRSLKEGQRPQPLTFSSKQAIASLTFTDPSARRWKWTPEEGLVSVDRRNER